MKKLFKKITILLFVFIFQSKAFSANKNQNKSNNKNIVIKKENAGNNNNQLYSDIKAFDNLSISGFAKVIFEYDENYSLKIETNEQIQKQLNVYSENGILSISINIENFSKHTIASYIGNNILKNNDKLKNECYLSIIKTDKVNFLVQDNKVYQTKAKEIEDLITIYIKAPSLESIVLNGNVKFIIKENLINNFENQKNLNKLSINANSKSKINIPKLEVASFIVHLSGDSTLNIDNLISNFLTTNQIGKSNIIIKNAKIKNNLDAKIKDKAFFKIINKLQCRESKITLEGMSAMNIHRIIHEDSIDLNLKDKSSMIINHLETVLLKVNVINSANLVIKNGAIVYKADILCRDNATIDTSKILIKEMKLISDGLGKAHVYVSDKIFLNSKNEGFTFEVEGEPEIIDENKKNYKNNIPKIKNSKKRKSKKLGKKNQKKSKKINFHNNNL